MLNKQKTLGGSLSFSITSITQGEIRDLKQRIKRGLTPQEKKLYSKYINLIKKGKL